MNILIISNKIKNENKFDILGIICRSIVIHEGE